MDLDRGTLRIGRQVVRLLKGTPTLKDGGKSHAASRTIKLTPATVAELRAYRTRWLERKVAAAPGWNPANLLFTTRDGRPLSANNLRKVFDRLVTAAGVPEVTPHAIGKTAITHALAGGASPKGVAARVGHAEVKQWQRCRDLAAARLAPRPGARPHHRASGSQRVDLGVGLCGRSPPPRDRGFLNGLDDVGDTVPW